MTGTFERGTVTGRKPSLRPFLIWLGIFYSAWLALVTFGGWWDQVAAHWAIAVAMAAGSYFAGSTPMGGGTVGFPVLVLLFDQPASLGRNFGLAVQSIGMVSASIYILSLRRPIDWHLLKPAMLGATIGTPLGAAAIAPFIPDIWVKLIFAVIWASFGVMHFIKLRAICASHGLAGAWHGVDVPIGLAIGITGGIVASMTGVGIDLMIYSVLVLLYRADLKVAIPTSVILMAYTSVIGIFTNLLLSRFHARYAVDIEVFYNWIAAAPIVALGAPLGALVVERIRREPTLLIVSVLCIGQFAWTLFSQGVTGLRLLAAFGGVAAMNAGFHVLYELGGKRRRALEAVAMEGPAGLVEREEDLLERSPV